MKLVTILLASAVLVVTACDKQSTSESKTEDPASKNTPTTGATTTVAATATAVIADTDLATPADFEETAEKAISKTNYKTELATLETDIAKE